MYSYVSEASSNPSFHNCFHPFSSPLFLCLCLCFPVCPVLSFTLFCLAFSVVSSCILILIVVGFLCKEFLFGLFGPLPESQAQVHSMRMRSAGEHGKFCPDQYRHFSKVFPQKMK